MKKIFLYLTTLSTCLLSCETPRVESPSLDGKVFLQVGCKILEVHKVIINSKGSVIYILTPKDTTVDVFIENVGFKQGKQQTSVIRVE